MMTTTNFFVIVGHVAPQSLTNGRKTDARTQLPVPLVNCRVCLGFRNPSFNSPGNPGSISGRGALRKWTCSCRFLHGLIHGVVRSKWPPPVVGSLGSQQFVPGLAVDGSRDFWKRAAENVVVFVFVGARSRSLEFEQSFREIMPGTGVCDFVKRIRACALNFFLAAWQSNLLSLAVEFLVDEVNTTSQCS
jgi:hypothetical protein